MTCFKCYQLEDHQTSSRPKSKEYKISSLCASQEHTHRECISNIRKCMNCKEEGNEHSTLAMGCPFRKNVSKKKRQEIMLNTNNRRLDNSHQSIQLYPAHSYSHVLAHSNSPGHSTPITSVNSPLGYTNPIPNSITVPIHPISAFEKSSISNVVISVLIATVKNNEAPGIFEAVLNSLLVANGLPQFKMLNVTPPSSIPSTSTDSASLNLFYLFI